MHDRFQSILWALLLGAGMSLGLSGCATVKSYDELSSVQISALQESNERLDVYDRRLQTLDDSFTHGKIRAREYRRQTTELTSLIQDESEFQNAIMTKDPKIRIISKNLLDTIQKAVAATPAIAMEIGVAILKSLSGASITP